MSSPPLNRANLGYWKERFSKVTPQSQRRFGKLEPAAMFRHLRRVMEPALGEYDAENVGNFFTRTLLFRQLFLMMPWPKGKVKVPEWVTPPAEGDLETERTAFFTAMERFVVLHEKNPSALTANPLLGNVTMEYTSKLQGKHLNHHAEQFGV